MRMLALLTLALTALLALLTTARAQDPAADRPKLPALPQKTVDAAVAADMIRYGRTNKGGAHTNGAWFGGPSVALGLAAWEGNESADKRLLEQIRYTLKGQNSISANGGYPAQHETLITGTYTLAKWTPRVWNQLTPAEQKAVDLVMKAALVSSAFTTSDATAADGAKPVALDGDHNLNRDWNPNYQEGMVGELVITSLYFGGGAAADKILDSYNHNAFVAELKDAGLTNTHDTFNWKQAHPESDAPDGKTIAANIKDFRFHKVGLADPFEIYYRLTVRTYGAKVTAGLNNGAGVGGAGKIATGADQLPNLGKDGMLTEFASRDAEGLRSSIGYCYHGFRPNLVTHLVLVAGGGWKKGPQADEALARMTVGITDLYYKLEHGYLEYSHAKGSTKPFTIDERGWNFAINRSLWQDVLQPYHQGGK